MYSQHQKTFGLEETKEQTGFAKLTMEELNQILEQAVQDEDYEKAAKVRDEISKREV